MGVAEMVAESVATQLPYADGSVGRDSGGIVSGQSCERGDDGGLRRGEFGGGCGQGEAVRVDHRQE